jgi:hypothetical protein
VGRRFNSPWCRLTCCPREPRPTTSTPGLWSEKAIKEAKLVGKPPKRPRAPIGSSVTSPADPVLGAAGVRALHDQQHDRRDPVQDRAERPAGSFRSSRIRRAICSAGRRRHQVRIDLRRRSEKPGALGVVLVIIRDDLVEAGPKDLPTMPAVSDPRREHIAL